MIIIYNPMNMNEWRTGGNIDGRLKMKLKNERTEDDERQ